uniref:Uncharacterized protein n=1 Tax=Triticum urartu TaxID=4572 RepID=A0A8R7QQE1_TRIUA
MADAGARNRPLNDMDSTPTLGTSDPHVAGKRNRHWRRWRHELLKQIWRWRVWRWSGRLLGEHLWLMTWHHPSLHNRLGQCQHKQGKYHNGTRGSHVSKINRAKLEESNSNVSVYLYEILCERGTEWVS